jgi:riboflavin biosynthesis pyrimidine reductase
VELTRVFPDAAVLAVEEALDGWDPGARTPDERPTVALNMVVSVDGRAALKGASAGLSVPADREVFHALRGRVDGVLAGTGTLRAEGYGRLVKDAARRAAREARGLAGDPLAVVLSRSGDVPDVPLLADRHQPSVILMGEDATPAAALAQQGAHAVLAAQARSTSSS